MSAPDKSSKWLVEVCRVHHCYILPYVFSTKEAAKNAGTWNSVVFEIPDFDPKMCPFTAAATAHGSTTSTTSTKDENNLV